MGKASTTRRKPTEHEAHVAEGVAKGRMVARVECPTCDGFGALSVPGPACPTCHGDGFVDALLPVPASGSGDLVDAACADLLAANAALADSAAYNGSFRGGMEAAATVRTIKSCKDAVRRALADGGLPRKRQPDMDRADGVSDSGAMTQDGARVGQPAPAVGPDGAPMAWANGPGIG